MKINLKQQRVGVTVELLELIEKRVKQLGVPSIPEYFRYLAINDVKNLVSEPVVDLETEESISRGLNDYKTGNSTTISNKEDLTKFLAAL